MDTSADTHASCTFLEMQCLETFAINEIFLHSGLSGQPGTDNGDKHAPLSGVRGAWVPSETLAGIAYGYTAQHVSPQANYPQFTVERTVGF